MEIQRLIVIITIKTIIIITQITKIFRFIHIVLVNISREFITFDTPVHQQVK